MTTPPKTRTTARVLEIRASAALSAALRAKKLTTAPIVIKHENDLHSLTPQAWVQLAVHRSRGEDCQFAACGAKYLATLFQDVTGWGAKQYEDVLIKLASNLNTHLANPMGLDDDRYEHIRRLYDLIPDHLQETAFAHDATNHL